MPSGVRVLAGLGIDLVAEGFPAIGGVRYRLAGGRSVRGELRTGHGCGVRRLRLDPLLAARAAATPGVAFLTGLAASGVEVGHHDVRVTTPQGELRAQALIGADGLRSPVARWLGWARPPGTGGPREARFRGWGPRGRPPRHALVGHLAAPPAALRDEIQVTLLGGVEVYAAPCGRDEVLVAVLGAHGALRAAGRSVTDSYRDAVQRAHPELATAPLVARLWGAGPFRTAPTTVADGRVFLVGDAAGFLDPLTGDGIASGLTQAVALAAALTAGVDLAASRQLAAAAARYRGWCARQWRRRRVVTRLALGLTGSTVLAARALAGTTRRPGALHALLEVNDGTRGLGSLGPRDWAALAGF